MSLLTFTDRKSGVKRNEIMSLQQILLLSKLWHKINTAAALILPHPPCRASSRNGMGGGWAGAGPRQFDLFMSGVQQPAVSSSLPHNGNGILISQPSCRIFAECGEHVAGGGS